MDEKTTPPTSSPTEDVEVTVGPVNTTFAPLSPEEIHPEAPEPSSDKPEEEAGPPPLQPPTPGPLWTPWGCLRDVLIVLLSMVLATVFVFLLLFALNGTLLLNDRDKTIQLALAQERVEEQIQKLMEQAEHQHQAVKALNARVETLQNQLDTLAQEMAQQQKAQEAINSRLADQKETLTQTQEDVQELQARQDELETTLHDLETQLQETRDAVNNFQQDADFLHRFVQDLAQVLSHLNQPPTTTPEATPSPTPGLTPESTGTPSSVEPRALFPPASSWPTPTAQRGLIFGLVWQDTNQDGQPQAHETPIPGIRVALQNAEGKALLTVVTDQNGWYAFIDVPPGEYRITILPTRDQTYAAPEPQTVVVQPGHQVEADVGLTIP